MACAKIMTVSGRIKSDLLHRHNCLFLIRQEAEDEFEAQPKRTHIKLNLV